MTVNKRKILFGSIGLVMFLAFTTFGSIVNFITDYKWFSELSYTGTYLTKLKTQLFIGVPLIAIVFIVFFVYLRVLKTSYFEEMKIVKNSENEKNISRFIVLGSIVLSLFLVVPFVSRNWYKILEFMNSQSFGLTDPIFMKDISFYVFKLPLINDILGFVIGFLIIFIIITVAFNLMLLSSKASKTLGDSKVVDFQEYLYKGKKLIDIFDKKTISYLITHVALIVSMFFIFFGASYWFKAYDLLYSTRGKVFGASYTDIAVTLKVYRLMGISAFISAITFFIGARKRNILLSLAVPAVTIAIAIIGSVFGFIIERFVVEPDQISKEMEYIKYNIDYTQSAFGLSNVKEVDYDLKNNLNLEALEVNKDIIENIRVNDARPIIQLYNQIQGLRPYYSFFDIDIGRYYIDGKYTQVFISARELDQSKLDPQAKTWINQYIKYTHGYGIALSPVNSVTKEGQPLLIVKDVPPKTTTDLIISRPEIYFGELTNDYIIVNTDEKEFDYPSGSDNSETIYEGSAGIKLSGLNKLLFAIKKGSLRLLISKNIDSKSKIILNRNIKERVQKIAPFIAFGYDPYLVLNQENGKLYWIIEGFTHTDRYPYSEFFQGVNYMRNSVKVVVDAYNGETNFYIYDEEDAIIKTYKKIFPDLFKAKEEMPEGLKKHIRYSHEFFDVQREVFRTYHMENPTVFFGREDLWDISKEKYLNLEQTIESNYLMFKLPDSENVEFLLSVPYSPNGKNNMTALFIARNDGDKYGELVLYRFSKNENIQGPNMVESRIDQDSEISPQLTLWSQEGSNVLRGNMLVIPIQDSLLYVEPIYLQADNENSLPEMKKVIVAYKDEIVMKNTLEEALTTIFGKAAETIEDQKTDEKTNIRELVLRASDLYNKAQDSLKNGNWSDYGKFIEELEIVINQMEKLEVENIQETTEEQTY